jgi:hypothetical protein
MPSRSNDDPLVLEDDARRDRELQIIAAEQQRRAPKVEQSPVSIHAEADRELGKVVRTRAPALAKFLLPFILSGGAGTAIGSLGMERLLAPSLDGIRADIQAKDKAQSDARAKLLERLEREEMRTAALACRVLVLADQAKRQGWDADFAEAREIQIVWEAGSLEDPTKPKSRVSAPTWKSRKACPDLPKRTPE